MAGLPGYSCTHVAFWCVHVGVVVLCCACGGCVACMHGATGASPFAALCLSSLPPSHRRPAVRVMAGSSLGVEGPIKLRNPGLLLDVRLAPGSQFQQVIRCLLCLLCLLCMLLWVRLVPGSQFQQVPAGCLGAPATAGWAGRSLSLLVPGRLASGVLSRQPSLSCGGSPIACWAPSESHPPSSLLSNL